MITRRKVLKTVVAAATIYGAPAKESVSAVGARSHTFRVPVSIGQGWQAYQAVARAFEEDLGEGVALAVAVIPGGDGWIGSTLPPRFSTSLGESPVHPVRIPTFGLGQYPITRRQWRRITQLPRVDRELPGAPFFQNLPDDAPVDLITWRQAEEACLRLSRLTGRTYRLPSEAEWEYACRAGTSSLYHFGDTIDRTVANINDGVFRPLTLEPIGRFNAPNRFGLHEMHGSVLEWCSDLVHEDYRGAPSDERPWIDGGDPILRIARGGMYISDAWAARSAARFRHHVDGSLSGLGLRVAVELNLPALDPRLSQEGVSNAASGSVGALCSSEIVSIHGTGLSVAEPTAGQADSDGALPSRLGGVRVLVNDAEVPILYASARQVNFLVPAEFGDRRPVSIVIDNSLQSSLPVWSEVAESAPGVFTADASGAGQAMCWLEDGSLNSADNRILPTTKFRLFVTGIGRTTGDGDAGQVSNGGRLEALLPVVVLVGGLEAVVHDISGVPGAPVGLVELAAQAPTGLAAGRQSVVIRAGQRASPEGVFVELGT